MGKEYASLETDPEFDAWWEIYPRKKSKGDARKAWEQTKKIRPLTPSLIKAVIVQRATTDWLKEGGKYIPYPATYLRDECWEDADEIDIESVHNGKAWHETVSGVQAKAKELGMTWEPAKETFQNFAARIKGAVADGKVVAIKTPA